MLLVMTDVRVPGPSGLDDLAGPLDEPFELPDLRRLVRATVEAG